jgi:hypothetical protein
MLRRRSRSRISTATVLVALAVAPWACNGGAGGSGASNDGGSGSGSSGSGGSGSSGGGSGSGSSGGGGDAGSCDPDPLHTGLTATQTGVSVDAFDCPILKWAVYYKEPDPMIFKAIIYVESRFDQLAVACPNLPCGTPTGWSTSECGCFGLMQVVPACGDDPNDAGLLPSGHPDMTTDPTSSSWAGSIFNPDVNIEIGISGVAGNRSQVEQQFPGCTVDQYTMMAVGNYNSYGSTKSCTQYNTAYDDGVIAAYQQYAAAAGYPAHSY